MKLDRKVAIVTGGAQGIGYAIAQRFLEDGAKVMISDADERAGEAAQEALSEFGHVAFCHCDVGVRLDVRNMVANTLDEFGDIDVLVNNAGVTAAGDFLTLSEDDFDRVLQVNLKGAFLCSQAVARHMVEKIEEGGSAGIIINISSVNSVLAIPEQVPYTVSKGGLNQLTNVSAVALAKYGIRVNGIGPGSIETDMLKAVVQDESKMNKVLSRTPLGRLGQPSEIAGVASFLASDDASYVSGQTIFADGARLPLNYTVDVTAPE
ncbi:Glucose 1-dehydrogenase 4 [Pseudovibrio axinellae]|uniref:Glucose 1-dehydrogenase 4 n=1 Tax=Pseudovibrio axinellae TaxID=989403 RepID=A0A166AAV3_9HYPH|nr:SDR family oxidoreductase [Pseudovibrio axinellae]KZL20804.1 Glucose 1-dehydrogenase 4 [Pseudovibrio axinellae]SER22041.1 NAD(P)-dependent dehydrogenase, short-chain alcohol dehydrogenase family [Pseudovibrio axinellae]